MTLDDKLKRLLLTINPEGSYKYLSEDEAEALVAQIKQAFIDEHWVEVERPGLLSEFFVTRKGKQIMITGCVITTKDDGRALEIRGATGEDARVPQPEPTEPEIVINKYEGHKSYKGEFGTLASLDNAEIREWTLTDPRAFTHPVRGHNDSSGDDPWPDTSPNAKPRVTEL